MLKCKMRDWLVSRGSKTKNVERGVWERDPGRRGQGWAAPSSVEATRELWWLYLLFQCKMSWAVGEIEPATRCLQWFAVVTGRPAVRVGATAHGRHWRVLSGTLPRGRPRPVPKPWGRDSWAACPIHPHDPRGLNKSTLPSKQRITRNSPLKQHRLWSPTFTSGRDGTIATPRQLKAEQSTGPPPPTYNQLLCPRPKIPHEVTGSVPRTLVLT